MRRVREGLFRIAVPEMAVTGEIAGKAFVQYRRA
ncbi:hypothetical protein ACVWXN_004716 [Bradyrhizobium sp. i1.4.4]